MSTSTSAVDFASASGTGPYIADSDFARFSDFFYQRTGIRFNAAKRYFVDKRLQECIRHAGERSFAGWFSALRLDQHPDWWQYTVNQLTVNETYFLREEDQFVALVQTVLPRVLAGHGRRGVAGKQVRILSIPCATGDEPYSIALYLLQTWPDIAHVDVEIVGADIDSDVLAAACEGRYSERSLHRVPPAWRAAHFTSDGNDHYRIHRDIADAVQFRQANLADAASVSRLGQFDVIFCRNVLIYFDQVSSHQAADNLYAALRPNGYLFAGRTESVGRIFDSLVHHRLPDGLVYQRPMAGEH